MDDKKIPQNKLDEFALEIYLSNKIALSGNIGKLEQSDFEKLENILTSNSVIEAKELLKELGYGI